jgi:hypothetical protein
MAPQERVLLQKLNNQFDGIWKDEAYVSAAHMCDLA